MLLLTFSIPVATLTILQYAVSNHVPIVIATTGFLQMKKNLLLKKLVKKFLFLNPQICLMIL